MNFQTQPNSMPAKLDLKLLEIKLLGEPLSSRQSDALCQKDANTNDKSPNEDPGRSITKGVPENEKIAEPVGATSSVCSGKSVERASNDPTVNLKRKLL